MIGFVVRCLGVVLIAGGFAAAIVDGTRSIAADSLMLMSVGEFFQAVLPKQFLALQTSLQHLQPAMAQTLVTQVLLVPNFIILWALGLLGLWIARVRPRYR